MIYAGKAKCSPAVMLLSAKTGEIYRQHGVSFVRGVVHRNILPFFRRIYPVICEKCDEIYKHCLLTLYNLCSIIRVLRDKIFPHRNGISQSALFSAERSEWNFL